MEHEATVPNQDRPGESVRDAKGYLPLDETDYGCCNFYGPVSTQLEYDSADYALASFAKSLGKTADYTKFATRAQDWMNVFNPQTGYMQGKNKDGQLRRRLHPRHVQRLRGGHLRAVHADGAVRPPGADHRPRRARRPTPRTSTACWTTSPTPAGPTPT